MSFALSLAFRRVPPTLACLFTLFAASPVGAEEGSGRAAAALRHPPRLPRPHRKTRTTAEHRAAPWRVIWSPRAPATGSARPRILDLRNIPAAAREQQRTPAREAPQGRARSGTLGRPRRAVGRSQGPGEGRTRQTARPRRAHRRREPAAARPSRAGRARGRRSDLADLACDGERDSTPVVRVRRWRARRLVAGTDYSPGASSRSGSGSGSRFSCWRSALLRWRGSRGRSRR